MSRPPFPLEPEPAELEAQTRAVADFVLAHLRSLDRQPSALADFVATATNRYVGVTQAAPVLAQIEETAVEALQEEARALLG
jgi:hypothetical protein